ncbi:MAG: hypothetical protein DI548_04220, partial [Flavobacterium johnsoniae]
GSGRAAASPIGKSELDVKIYPNPNNGQFTITVDKASAGDVQYAIYDITGKVIESKSIESDGRLETAVDISRLPSGTYIINVTTDNQEFTKKIIKN